MKLAALVLVLVTVLALAFRSEGIRTALAVRAVAPGMTIEEAEAILAPHIVAKGYTHGMGSGGRTFYFHLKGDLELVLQEGWFPNWDRIDRISSLRRKQPWDRIFWEPTESDLRVAFEVASRGSEPPPVGVRYDYGRWRTQHRLLDVTLIGESGRQRWVTVDVDDGRIVVSPAD